MLGLFSLDVKLFYMVVMSIPSKICIICLIDGLTIKPEPMEARSVFFRVKNDSTTEELILVLRRRVKVVTRWVREFVHSFL